MPIRLLFDQSKAVIGKTTKVVLTESDQRELVRAQFSGDARLVKLVPVGGTGRNGGMRMRWTSGETCEFVFTPEVLEYELIRIVKTVLVAHQRAKNARGAREHIKDEEKSGATRQQRSRKVVAPPGRAETELASMHETLQRYSNDPPLREPTIKRTHH